MSIYDPEPGKPYGSCINCGAEIGTRDDMTAHFDATRTNGRTHSVRVTNPTRAERIESALQDYAEEAAAEFADNVTTLLDADDVTEEEVTEAMRTVYINLDEALKDPR